MDGGVGEGPAVSDEWIIAPVAAARLGVTLNTVYALINRGELPAEVSFRTDRPKGRRSVRLRQRDVDEFLAGARVKPGELRHLYEAATGRYLPAPGPVGAEGRPSEAEDALVEERAVHPTR